MRSFLVLTILACTLTAAAACGDDGADAAPSSGSSDASTDSGPGPCTADDQCEGRCNAGVCTAPTTTDGKTSPSIGETDVDCGGDNAPACAEGHGCAADKDCTTKICGLSKKCVLVRSCGGPNGPAGMETCGSGEPGAADAKHESCCKSLPLPTTKTRRLDKYEITAGRMRTFIAALAAENGGEPNVRAFVKAYAAAHPDSELGKVATDFPALLDILPESKGFDVPMPLQAHLGAFPIDAMNALDGCFTSPGANGHATYWQAPEDLKPFGVGDATGARKFGRDVLDTKPLNCVMPLMLAAFCAWDGGELARTTDYREVWGTKDEKIGGVSTMIPWTKTLAIGEFNFRNGPRAGTCAQQALGWPGCVDPQPYHYQFPSPSTADDDTTTIGAPGRFPLDVTAIGSEGGEGWVDLAGNLLEAAWPVTGMKPPTREDFCDMSVAAPPKGDPQYCERQLKYTAADGTPVDETRSGVKRFTGKLPAVMFIGYSFEGHSRGGDAYLRTGDESAVAGAPATFQYGKIGGRCARPAP